MDEDMHTQKPGGVRPWKILALVLMVISIILALTLIFVLSSNLQSRSGVCSEGMKINTEVTQLGPFSDLTLQEIIAVRDYMTSHPSLGIKPQNMAYASDSYIHSIELQVPPKEKTLDFLDRKGPMPRREAKVVVFRGDAKPPKVEEYLVWPPNKPQKHMELKNPSYLRNPIPFHARPVDSMERKQHVVLLKEVTKKAYKILIESYGAGHHNCTPKGPCLIFVDTAPRWLHSGERRSWCWFLREVEGYYLHPVGFQALINHEGPDMSKWHVEKVFYNSQMFDSVEALVQGYESGKVKKVKLPELDPKVPPYSSYEQRGKPSSAKPLLGPKQFEPDGKRYTVNGRHVEYMGWSFEWRLRIMSGVQIFDIRFNNERIIYELSVQDAAVLYSGWNPMQGTSNYYDSGWSFGSLSYELQAGLDCPEHATFFDNVLFVDGHEPIKLRRNVCIFEQTSLLPLRRHHSTHDKTYIFHGGMEDHSLVVRSIAVIWNYDYIFDYIFHQDGTIEVRTALTGYVQSTYLSPEELKYGRKIYDYVVASMHHHIFNYKVDFDILGVKNRFATLDIELENKTNPWYPSENKVQKTFVSKLKSTEKEATYKFNFDTPKYLVVYNEKQKNIWGTKRGYKINNLGVSKKLIPDNYAYEKGGAWARYQTAITKQNDWEEASTSIYSESDPFDPVVNFQTYIDNNDNIVDQDLVAWVTMGTHHVPRSEDVPSTATPGATLAFYLQPYNYFDHDPSLASYNNIVIKPTNNFQAYSIKGYGTEGGTCQAASTPFKFNGTVWQ